MVKLSTSNTKLSMYGMAVVNKVHIPVGTSIASQPGHVAALKRAWYALFAHAQKFLGIPRNRYIVCTRPCYYYVTTCVDDQFHEFREVRVRSLVCSPGLESPSARLCHLFRTGSAAEWTANQPAQATHMRTPRTYREAMAISIPRSATSIESIKASR